jgi:cyclase
MSPNPRFIPVLQIQQRKLIKTVKFIPRRYLGDPLNAVRIFNLKEVSELIITDVHATQSKIIDFDFLQKLSAQAFVPLTYGGGIRSIDEVHKLYQLGFDRILLGISALENPKLISEIAKIYGIQSIICSIVVTTDLFKRYKIMYQGNKKNFLKVSLDTIVRNFIDQGAGEILLHDQSRDGTYKGLDYGLIRKISALSPVPIIACGGLNSIKDAQLAFKNGASAVAAGSFFSFYGKHKAVLINYCVNNNENCILY